MGRYVVYFDVLASTVAVVTAGSADEAKELAYRKVDFTLCQQCSKRVEVIGVGRVAEIVKIDEEV